MQRERLIRMIQDYADSAGLKPSTVCQRAVSNGRLFDRLKLAEQRDEAIANRLVQWMQENPPKGGDTAS